MYFLACLLAFIVLSLCSSPVQPSVHPLFVRAPMEAVHIALAETEERAAFVRQVIEFRVAVSRPAKPEERPALAKPQQRAALAESEQRASLSESKEGTSFAET